MYKCELTNVLVGPNIPLHKVVLEKRYKTYERVLEHGRNKGKVVTAQGWEIVKEVNVSPEKYKELTGLEPTLTNTSTLLKDARVVEEPEQRRPRFPRREQQNNNRKQPSVEYRNGNNQRRSR